MSAIHEVDGRQDATITVALDIDHVGRGRAFEVRATLELTALEDPNCGWSARETDESRAASCRFLQATGTGDDLVRAVADWIRRNIPFHRYDKF